MASNQSSPHPGLPADDLLAFLVVAEEGSINRAAARLSTSQPALSRTIKSFEQTVGAAVFERHSRGVELTPVGEVVAEQARAIRAEMLLAERAVRERVNGRSSTIHLGLAMEPPMLLHLGLAVQRIQLHAPEVGIRLTTGRADDLWAQLSTGVLDCVIGTPRDEASGQPVIEKHLLDFDLGIFCRESHPLAASEQPLAVLVTHDWMISLPGTPARTRLEGLCRRHQLALPRLLLETDHAALQLMTLLQVDTLTVLPTYVALGRLLSQVTCPEWTPNPHPIVVATRASSRSSQIDSVIEILQGSLADRFGT